MDSRPTLARSVALAMLCLLAYPATPQTLSPTSVSFGNWVVQTTSSNAIVTLKNNQTVALTIAGISTSGDFAETSNCPLSPNALPPSASCTISVTFTPAVTGSRTGTLTVSDDASNSPQTEQLTGTGVSAVTLSPMSLSFGSLSLNTTSAAKTVTVRNYQTVPLTITEISASGDFVETTNCPQSPITLGAKLSCTISVTFTPTATGSRTGTLTISEDAPNSSQSALLTGTGVLPVVLSPSSLSFGSQFLNAAGAAKTVTLKNNQTVPLAIAGISASGDFSQNSNCPMSPSTLGVNLTCTISVTFTPTALGWRTGTLTVSDSASTSPQLEQLTGSGTVPVSLSPASLSFASQILTTASAAKNITVKNNLAVPLTIASISATDDFAQTSNCPLPPNTLARGASCSVSVRFTPTALGARTGTLTVSDDASTSPQMEALSGTGTLSGLASIAITPGNPTFILDNQQQLVATGAWSGGVHADITQFVNWSSSVPSVASVNSCGLLQALTPGTTTITANYGPVTGKTAVTVTSPELTIPTNFRVDISVGTTGQLFISWNSMKGANYYNLQRSTDPASGYSMVAACSGKSSLKYTNTTTTMMACRDGGLAPRTIYYYQVQSCFSAGCSEYSTAASNVSVTSDCTPTQIPDTVGVQTLPAIVLQSSIVDPDIQFLPDKNQYAYYASPSVARRNLLVVDLPGSDETCPAAGAFNDTAVRLGFDVICVNYSNLTAQQMICAGDPGCFGNISQAKLDATGVCSSPGQAHCGLDPKTGQPFYLSNPADAVTQRVSMMLQYLSTHGYNQNGTDWGKYLSGTTPYWENIVFAGHSQGGVMATFAAYKHEVARAINLSAPPQATPVNGIEIAADYFLTDRETDIRKFYGLVSVYDQRYEQGVFQAVWQSLGFTPENNNAEVMLNTSAPVGLNCNSGIPSHNFSNSAPAGLAGGHAAPLYLWNEDIYKFMLID